MSDCKKIQNQIDGYLDCSLSESNRVTFLAHIAKCPACADSLELQRVLRKELQSLQAPEPTMEFTRRAFRNVRKQHPQRHYLTLSAAAVILIAVLAALPFALTNHSGEKSVAGIQMQVNEIRNITLQFDVPQQVPEAVMIVELPEHVEIEGYPQRRRLRWTTALAAGKNALSMRVVAKKSVDGEFVTTVKIGDKRHTFKTRLTVTVPTVLLTDGLSKTA